jgi:hypothetical protein
MKVEIVFVRLGATAHPNREQTLFLVFHVKEVGVGGGGAALLRPQQLLCHEILMLGWGGRKRGRAPSPTKH